MLQIRQTQPADLDDLRRMFNATVVRGDAFVYEEPVTSDRLQAYFDTFTNLFTAELNGKVVGGYCLRANLPGRGSHVCNAVYVVDEAYRGQGIGKKMGEDSLKQARELGFTAMQFNAVVSTNDAALLLWRGLGFDIVGTIPGGFRLADGSFVDLFVMHRKL